MFKKIVALSLALALLVFAVPALGESADSSDMDTVTAVGTATITLTPDMATFTVGVSTQDQWLAAARKQNAELMQKVLDSLKAAGVDAKDLQTENYSVNPVYDYQNGKFGQLQTLSGYSVSNNVSVTVRKLDQLPDLLDAAVAAGANQTYGVNFQSSQNTAAYDQALAAAAQDALRKAKLMAEAMGRTVGKVISLSEANDVYVSYASSKTFAYDAAAATPIEAGTLTVSANVRAVVEMQ